ncbi:hypothetical protein R1flu_017097 [Riccia fluitans]|uniref:Uncharacterized protein n=1 Tax=Riccia fluitans TaxID=41844 RepID=A0ABD1YNR9_9MARC
MTGDSFTDLYKDKLVLREDLAERKVILALLDRPVKEEDNRRLEMMPEMKNLETIVKDMAKEKAPGEDGITIEVLLVTF